MQALRQGRIRHKYCLLLLEGVCACARNDYKPRQSTIGNRMVKEYFGEEKKKQPQWNEYHRL